MSTLLLQKRNADGTIEFVPMDLVETAGGDPAILVVAHIATLSAGEDQLNDVQVVEQGQFAYEYITTAKTSDLSQNAGAFLHSISVLSAALTGTVTIYDETTGGATLLVAVLPIGTLGGTYTFNNVMTQGLQIVTSNAADDIHVSYRPSYLD